MDEVSDELLVDAEFLEEVLFAEVVPAALFPGADALFSERTGELAEVLDDLETGEAAVEYLIDAGADFFGEAGDFAVAAVIEVGSRFRGRNSAKSV